LNEPPIVLYVKVKPRHGDSKIWLLVKVTQIEVC
jgi:hypothetical protein